MSIDGSSLRQREGLFGVSGNQGVSGIVSALRRVFCQGVDGYHPEIVGTLLT